jgi:hypothetical protein
MHHTSEPAVRQALPEATRKLLAYCRAHDWAGYDPYDALNSRLLEAFPFLDSRIPRLVLTQALKRSPINIRPLMGIRQTHNPKGIALFLAASLKLSHLDETSGAEDLSRLMIDKLIALRSAGTPYWCWGYSFPWQTRTLVVPRGAPNLVCTSFVADALLDADDQLGDGRCLTMATSAAEYFVRELYWTEGSGVAGFSYPVPSLRMHIHNSNLLGAAVCCRVYRATGDRRFLAPALRVARYSAAHQHEDGSWYYGEHPTQQWIDNFHTGFNLCALHSIGYYAGTAEFEPCIRRGLKFYRDHFFRGDGAARYFHNRTYPVDIHSVAQGIITLLQLRDLDVDNVRLAQSVHRWAMEHMWNERGFFYYRMLRWGTIRTPFMRWSQAWMLLALSSLWEATSAAGESLTGAGLEATGSPAAVA